MVTDAPEHYLTEYHHSGSAAMTDAVADLRAHGAVLALSTGRRR